MRETHPKMAASVHLLRWMTTAVPAKQAPRICLDSKSMLETMSAHSTRKAAVSALSSTLLCL